MIWTAKQLTDALGITIPDIEISGKVTIHSKQVTTGDLFIALSTGNTDGHHYVQDALTRGAAAAIVTNMIDGIDHQQQLLVQDSFAALNALAHYKRKHSQAKFIAVTGSVGKTTTKEMLKTTLSCYGKTFANYGTFNNYLGVPLSLASIANDAEYAIIEMGMNKPNELNTLGSLVRPDVVLITTISEGHIEFFDSVLDIADAKCELLNHLDINNGIVIINRDMDMHDRCMQNIKQLHIKNTYSFGKHMNSYVCLTNSEHTSNGKLLLEYTVGQEKITFTMGAVPLHYGENIGAVLALIALLNLRLEIGLAAIQEFVPMIGRGQLVEVWHKHKKLRVICDYYNANPQSMIAALKYFASFNNNMKVAILGDMTELGRHSLRLHLALVKYIENANISKLILIGDVMPKIRDQINHAIQILCFTNVNELIQNIDNYLADEQLLLIKGSRALNLDKIALKLGIINAL